MHSDIVLLIAGSRSVVGAIVIFVVGVWATIELMKKDLLKRPYNYNTIRRSRRSFTSKMMIGLEFSVAGDLIKTVLEPSFDQVLVIAVIVAIRTIISYSLNKELSEIGPEEKRVE
jgi:uncharacterized membrane protein